MFRFVRSKSNNGFERLAIEMDCESTRGSDRPLCFPGFASSVSRAIPLLAMNAAMIFSMTSKASC
jgi:hypothetical protein